MKRSEQARMRFRVLLDSGVFGDTPEKQMAVLGLTKKELIVRREVGIAVAEVALLDRLAAAYRKGPRPEIPPNGVVARPPNGTMAAFTIEEWHDLLMEDDESRGRLMVAVGTLFDRHGDPRRAKWAFQVAAEIWPKAVEIDGVKAALDAEDAAPSQALVRDGMRRLPAPAPGIDWHSDWWMAVAAPAIKQMTSDELILAANDVPHIIGMPVNIKEGVHRAIERRKKELGGGSGA